MANFGYLGSLGSMFLSLFNYFGGVGYTKRRFKRNFWKCIASFILVCLLGKVLIRVYEVPVYYTKIDMLSHHCKPVAGEELSISIMRDYDRADKRSNFPDTIDDKYKSGIFIEGIFHSNPNTSNDNPKRTDSIKKVLENIFVRFGHPQIQDPQIIYISAKTSYRQSFLYLKQVVKEDTITHKDVMVHSKYFNGEIFKKYDVIYTDYFQYGILKSISGNNGCIMEDYYSATKDDSLIYVFSHINTQAHKKPSVWKTAEDVSKIVEVIEIGHSSREKDDYAGAWGATKSLKIDYVGPVEFSENIIPIPDKITLNSILYTDKTKIEEIGRNGLRFHVKFPDMENIQESRIFILSGLLTGLTALFLKYLYRILTDMGRYVVYKLKRRSEIPGCYFFIAIIVILLILSFLFLLVYGSDIQPFDIQNNLLQR